MAIPLKGTHRDPWHGAKSGGAPDLERDVLLTFWLPEPDSRETLIRCALELGSIEPKKRTYLSAADLRTQTDARDAEFKPLEDFCKANGFDVVEKHWRSAVVRGVTGRVVEALNAEIKLGLVEIPTGLADNPTFTSTFRMRVGSIHVPDELHGGVRAALGLHQWPKSAPLSAQAPKAQNAEPQPPPLLPIADVCRRYGLPDNDGAGQTIGIIQLNASFSASDFEAAMAEQGIHAQPPLVRRVDDAALTHKAATAKDIESSIDTQIAALIAPGARFVVYEAPNSERGLLDALRTAIFDRENAPSVISVSFGWPEFLWTPVVLEIFDELFAAAALLGITIVCASGDRGSAPPGQLHAPASSALALACGATVTGQSGEEEVWPHSGGGFSSSRPVPAWQNTVAASATSFGQSPGRGVPDLCALMAFPIVSSGADLRSGGTSASAPFIASAVARLNQRIGARCGFISPLLYHGAPDGLRTIASGITGTYSVGPGWNPCSGLGAPAFDRLGRRL